MTGTFPTLSVLGWPRKRTPVWSTLKQPSIGGQETRQELWTYPQWKYELTFDLLRSDQATQEWQQVLGLYNQMRGSSRVFAFNDLADNTASQQAFGVGDGVTTSFQLVRSLGGFAEPVFAPTQVTVQKSDWQGLTGVSSGSRTNLIPTSIPQGGAWSAAGVLSTVSKTAPDGASTCTEFTEISGSSFDYVVETATIAVSAGQTYTQTIWAAPLSVGSKRYLVAFFGVGWVGGNVGAVFDVVLGTVTTSGAGVTASMTPGTGGWYRCVATAVVASGITSTQAVWRISASATDIYGSQTGDGVSGLYLDYAQFELGAAGTSYIPTSGADVTVTDFSVGTTGLVAFTSAPAAGTSLLWSGTFSWLCRFDDDQMEFQQDYSAIWSLKSCKFTTVKL